MQLSGNNQESYINAKLSHNDCVDTIIDVFYFLALSFLLYHLFRIRIQHLFVFANLSDCIDLISLNHRYRCGLSLISHLYHSLSLIYSKTFLSAIMFGYYKFSAIFSRSDY